MRRREFLSLCGLAAGSCLVPDAVARVIRETCVLAREPYLILPRNPTSTLYALSSDGKTDFMLHLGNPFEEEKLPTWREYFDEYESIDIDDKEAVEEWWREQVGDPEDDPITIQAHQEIDGAALARWETHQELFEGPTASAFRYLEGLPLDDDRGLGEGILWASCVSSRATAPDRTSPMWRLPISLRSPACRTALTSSAKTSPSKSMVGK